MTLPLTWPPDPACPSGSPSAGLPEHWGLGAAWVLLAACRVSRLSPWKCSVAQESRLIFFILA